jgi:hypothetical protein
LLRASPEDMAPGDDDVDGGRDGIIAVARV